jgi:hypothetical protein
MKISDDKIKIERDRYLNDETIKGISSHIALMYYTNIPVGIKDGKLIYSDSFNVCMDKIKEILEDYIKSNYNPSLLGIKT